jgi:hypothetical protein
MGLIVDSNVVKGYYQDTVLGKGHDLTESPRLVFDQEFRKHLIYLDNKQVVWSEWKAAVKDEWFDIWYANLLRDDVIREIPAAAEKNFRKELTNFGFPFTGRDIWYARVANAVSENFGFAILISEDLDFYEPKEKGCKSARRNDILLKELGSLRKHLKKQRNIQVKAVARFISDYPGCCA